MLSKFKDIYKRQLTAAMLISYLSNPLVTFYDGSKAKAESIYAYCGDGGFPRYNCSGDGLYEYQEFVKKDGTPVGTTAQAVTPSYPFKSFWLPVYVAPSASDGGFGVGISPDNNGINVVNESNLVHEALHGMTGLYDDRLDGNSTLEFVLLGKGDQPSVNISKYIRDNVLNTCPTFNH